MGFPEGVTRVTVSSGLPFLTLGGAPVRGSMLFVGPELVTVGPLQLTLSGAEPVALDATGMLHTELVPPDLTGMDPDGWTYEVRTAFENAPNWVRQIQLTKANLSVVLSDVLVPNPVAARYATLVPLDQLGGAALLDVGTTANTVAAGDDPRFGQGGGGGAGGFVNDDPLQAGIVTLTATSSWIPVPGVSKTIPCAAGHRVLWSPSFLRGGTAFRLDAAIMKSDGVTVSRFVSTGTSTPAFDDEGYAPFYNNPSFVGIAGTRMFVPQADEISPGGTVTMRLMYIGPSIGDTSNKVYWGTNSTGYRGYWMMLDLDGTP